MPESLFVPAEALAKAGPSQEMLRSTLRPEVRSYADNLWAQINDALLKQGIKNTDDELSGPKAAKIPLQELQRIQDLVHLLTKVRETGELPVSELSFTLKDALNPYHEAMPNSQERKDITIDLLKVLEADMASYRGSTLPSWVQDLEGVKITLSPEKRRIIEQELADGCIPIFMPGSRTQQETTPEQYQQNLKPVWIKDGVPTLVADAYLWDHLQNLITQKDPSLTQDVPEKPYILLGKPTQKPEARTCSKTVPEQQAEFTKMNQKRVKKGLLPLGSLKPLEYAAVQKRFTEMLEELLKAQGGAPVNCSPLLDSTTVTRFIDLPLADGGVPYGSFYTGDARLEFNWSSAASRSSGHGFRPVGRLAL